VTVYAALSMFGRLSPPVSDILGKLNSRILKLVILGNNFFHLIYFVIRVSNRLRQLCCAESSRAEHGTRRE
jgi:hypothetical protein